MKILDKLNIVPEKIYILICTGVFLVLAFSIYFLIEDTRVLEKKIASKQKDLSAVLKLRDSYEARKRLFEKHSSQKVEAKSISLGLVEEMVKKNFVGGMLTMLQPGTIKEEKGKQQMVIEVKVTGAPLGEVISFLRAADASGLYVKKLRLSLPAANPVALDVYATVVERYSHG